MYSLRRLRSVAVAYRSISYAPGTKIPVNIMKDGKDPVLLADAEYPAWLFKIADPVRYGSHRGGAVCCMLYADGIVL